MIPAPHRRGSGFPICAWLGAFGALFALAVTALAQNIEWTHGFGGIAGDDLATDVAADATGVYVVGFVWDALPGQRSAGGRDAFVRKYDSSGTEQWTRQFGSSNCLATAQYLCEDVASGVAVDATGVYVIGYTRGALPGQSNVGGYDVFVRKYDASGTEQWTWQFGTPGNDEAFGVAANATGVYIVGQTGGWLAGQPNAGGSDGFVRKYEASGTEQWTRLFGAAGQDRAEDVAVDAATGIYVVGSTAPAGAQPGQASDGGGDAYVRKYDARGTELWVRQFGGTRDDRATGVVVDATAVYVVGTTFGALPGQTTAGASDPFLRKYDLNGLELWTRQFGTTSDEGAWDVAADATGVYVVGYTRGTLPGQTHAGLTDGYIRKYALNGLELWTLQFGTTRDSPALAVISVTTSVYVVGSVTAPLPGQTWAGGNFDAYVLKTTAATRPVTGQAVTELVAIDQFMTTYMNKWSIPGGAVAVSRNGVLVYARGFGWADRDAREPAQPDSLFRIASVSKPLTAVAVMKLVEEGKLSLDANAFDLLSEYVPSPLPPGFDQRLRQVTVRQLLHHTGGWDRNAPGSFDPIGKATEAALALGEPVPGNCSTIIRYMMRFRLNFDPGQAYAYSNFGYCVLGRIIEKISGQPYEDQVQARLKIMGIERMRQSRTGVRWPGEARYYGYPGQQLFPAAGGLDLTSAPYAFYIEPYDAVGGWIGSSVDLVRFANAVDGRRGFGFLSPQSVAEMVSRPPAPVTQNASSWYAKGWQVRSSGRDFNWWHTGGFDGTQSELVRLSNGVVWAAILNVRPQQWETSLAELDVGVNAAIASVTSWPSTDLFPSFAPDNRPQIAQTRGVENGASYTSGYTSGGWVQIRGKNLAPTTRTWQAQDFKGDLLPSIMDGVEVRINGKPASIYYISPSQINVQAPEDNIAGTVWVQVSRDGVAGEPAMAEVRRNSPGLFQYGPDTTPFAAAVHLNSSVVGDPGMVPGTVPAAPGERVLLFGSNFTPSPAGHLVPEPIRVTEPVRVTVGGRLAVVEHCALISPGLFQVNIIVPENVPAGNQEVTVEVNGVRSKNGVLLAIRFPSAP